MLQEKSMAHSALVEINIEQRGTTFPVAQLGPDFLLLARPRRLQGLAEIVLSVDGVTRRRKVRLRSSGKIIRLFPV